MDLLEFKRKLEGSGLFDSEWYASKHPDVAIVGLDPMTHFINYGSILGRDPGPGFNTNQYISEHPDVASSNLTPIQHYLLNSLQVSVPTSVAMVETTKSTKFAETPLIKSKYLLEVDMHQTPIGLYPHPNFEQFGYSLQEYPADSCLTLPARSRKPTKLYKNPDVGIHLHLYYPELLDEFIEHLANIEFNFSLYVSVPSLDLITETQEKLVESLPEATVTVKSFPNRGRDIAPFICGFGEQLIKHDLLAHFHTKQSPHNLRKADWRNQLLTYLLGSASAINRMIRHFQESRNIGLMFPIYHYSLKGQISWGANFDECQQLATKLGLNIDREKLHLFPAGSMFWARCDALYPLFNADLTFDDFPEEQNQVDGTTAHAVERLFGEIAHHSGYDLLQVKTDKPFNLTHYYPKKWPYIEPLNVSQVILDYQKNKKSGNKTVVYTALTGGYDQPVRHEHLNPNYDYVIFSDLPLNNNGFWDVRPIDFWHPDGVRMARRIKTSPHIYLKEYETAIWIDANVVIRKDIKKYVDKLKNQHSVAIAGIPHPHRKCAYKEAQIVVDSNKDISGRVDRQMRTYESFKFPKEHDLIESNFLVIDLKNKITAQLMSDWWSQINKYSHRDQLSLNFVLWKNNARWIPLMTENKSLRTNSDFAYLGHGANSGYITKPLKRQVRSQKINPLENTNGVYKEIPDVDSVAIDFVICVHNALEETKLCLESVLRSKRAMDQIIIVDDASDVATSNYLKEFAQSNRAWLLRNEPPANGYCVSANKGMATTSNRYFLLLNSDTVITPAALKNMLIVAEQDMTTGIVGPLSNAASTQSIPDIKSSAKQTAVNEIPAGMSVDDLNELCQKWSHPNLTPQVPLVHGFCQLIRRSVYEEIGGFDEKSFPHGYGEENDFCLRAADAGFNLKVATKAYVFHSKSASYTDSERRQKLMQAGAQKLREKHTQDRVSQAIKQMEGHPGLQCMRKKALNYFGKGE